MESMTGTAAAAHDPVAPQNMPQSAAVPTAAAPPADDLIGDLLGFDSPAPAAPAQVAAAASSSTSISLAMDATMSGEEYQAKWTSICSDADAIVEMVSLSSIPDSTSPIEAALNGIGIKTMASGQTGPGEFKVYLYARDAVDSSSVILIQSNISNEGGEALMILTIKIDGTTSVSEKASQLIPMIQNALR